MRAMRAFNLWRAPFLVFLGSCILGIVVSCATAGGEVSGGGLTEAGVLATTPPVYDGGLEVNLAILAAIDAACPTDEWRVLYRDLFGPTGKGGSCSFNETCHGSPSGTGAQSGSGIQC